MKKILFLAMSAAGLLACTDASKSLSYTERVNVFIGTGGHGHTFPGATLPHGMVQLSPDTRQVGWDACAGYYYDDSSIMGFSHTHLSGTGIGDYGDILFMPVVGDKPLRPGSNEHPEEGYRSRYSHRNESAVPGYYEVMLDDDSIHAELTATLRTGWHRYTYPAGSDARVIIDMSPSIHHRNHPVTRLRVLNDTTIVGMREVRGWAPRRTIYFHAVTSSPFKARFFANEQQAVEGDSVSSRDAKGILSFSQLPANGELLIKVGLSAVDEEGARRNLETEATGWDFEGTMAKADMAWNKELGVIDVETKDNDLRTIFYTSLYHAFVHPSIASDVDGRYRTMSQEIAQDTAYMNYTVFSLWDTFRAAHPFYTIATPDKNEAFIRTLMRKYEEGGILPKWELASTETGTMIGYHAVSVIADALMKRQGNHDLNKLLEACVRSSVYDTTGITPVMDRQVLHGKMMSHAIKYKNELGYIPCDKVGGSVSQALEFAYNDWLIAMLAKECNRKDLFDQYMQLSKAYRHYFDPETKLMRGRLSDGSWITPFDPSSVERPSNYVEGNAWQWAWFVPHDVDGLMELVGGREAFKAHLDTLFTTSSELTGDPNAAADVTGMIGQYAHGNEPSHHIPYLYNYVGAPHKTQELVDQILQTLYHNDPNGLCGNEDVGQMSAWYLLSSMGFYSFCPGRPTYEIGRPLFDKVTIHLNNGNDFVIRAINNSRQNKYIRSMKLNGKELSEPRFSHFDLMKGGELVFEMKGE
ncbi:MAG: GH92 family glycosyl hydrolase [Bacteroides sp.]|nr:GH92 family glycosyl hydrolase [Bacteroides sp.]